MKAPPDPRQNFFLIKRGVWVVVAKVKSDGETRADGITDCGPCPA